VEAGIWWSVYGTEITIYIGPAHISSKHSNVAKLGVCIVLQQSELRVRQPTPPPLCPVRRIWYRM
jgi:hypothetical protein